MSHLNGNDSSNIKEEKCMHTFFMLYSGTDCGRQLCVDFKKLNSKTSVLVDVDKDSIGFKVILRPLFL